MSSIEVTVQDPMFLSFFDTIVKDLTEEYWGHPQLGAVMSRLKEVLEHIAIPRQFNRGMTVLASFQELAGPELQKEDIIQRVLAVSWCIELNGAFTLMADDIIDKSETRFGKICWHKKDGIGLGAINDACLLDACAYRLLKKYCCGQPYYLKLVELFLEATYLLELGQSLDIITAEVGKADLEGFSEARQKAIVTYKSGFTAYYMPVAAAMYMAGIDDEKKHEIAKKIIGEITMCRQIQDDYTDCYGDPTTLGTDIQENKCTWPVVQALKRVTPEQKRILEENYGKNDMEKVQRVKQLYKELDLPAIYKKYQEESYQRLQTLISQHANGLPKSIFLGLVDMVFKKH